MADCLAHGALDAEQLTYGIGYTRAVLLSNPQTYVRAYEVETVTTAGQHHYVVAIDINAAQHN